MTTRIPYDDLRPDMWVTIRDLPEEEETSVSPFDSHAEAMGRLRRRRRPVARPGVPLRVLSVDLPFLYLAVLDGDGDEVGPVILDLRDQPVVGIDESVPHAIIAFGWRKREDAQSRCTEAAGRAAMVEAATEVARCRCREDAGLPLEEETSMEERGGMPGAAHRHRRGEDRCEPNLVAEVRRILERHLENDEDDHDEDDG